MIREASVLTAPLPPNMLIVAIPNIAKINDNIKITTAKITNEIKATPI